MPDNIGNILNQMRGIGGTAQQQTPPNFEADMGAFLAQLMQSRPDQNAIPSYLLEGLKQTGGAAMDGINAAEGALDRGIMSATGVDASLPAILAKLQETPPGLGARPQNPLPELLNAGPQSLSPNVTAPLPDLTGAGPQTLSPELANPLAALMGAGPQNLSAGMTNLPDLLGAGPQTLSPELLAGTAPTVENSAATAPAPTPATPPVAETPEAVVEQIASKELGPSKELMDTLTPEQKEDLSFFDNPEAMGAMMMALSLFSGKDYDRAAMQGLGTMNSIRDRALAGEDRELVAEDRKIAAEDRKIAAKDRRDASARANRQEGRDEKALNSKVTLQAAQAKAAEASAKASLDAAKAKALGRDKSISEGDYAKLITDQISAIEANNLIADTPSNNPQFDAHYNVNAALPESSRQAKPFTANDQGSLQAMMSDPTVTETQALSEIQRAYVVYGKEAVDAWLNTL